MRREILITFNIYIEINPKITNNSVFLKFPEKAATNATKSIITLTALHPSVIRATSLPFKTMSCQGF